MKKLVLILFLLAGNLCVSQITKEIKGTFKASISQKQGDSSYNDNYTLFIEYDKEKFKFKTSEKTTYSILDISKSTDKYVISKRGENYFFYDVKKQQLFAIDYFMKRYLITGLGSSHSTLKQTSEQMIKMLKQGKSQKDVIMYLVQQTEYDF